MGQITRDSYRIDSNMCLGPRDDRSNIILLASPGLLPWRFVYLSYQSWPTWLWHGAGS